MEFRRTGETELFFTETGPHAPQVGRSHDVPCRPGKFLRRATLGSPSESPKEVLGRRWRGWVLKVLAEGQLIALGATRPVRAAAKTHRSAGASKTSRSNPRQRTSVIQVCGELVLVLVPVYAVLSDTDSTGKSHIVVYTKSVLVEQTTPAALALTDVSKSVSACYLGRAAEPLPSHLRV